MSPRRGAKLQISLLFFLHLRHESLLYIFRQPRTGIRHHRHLPPVAAYHPLSVAFRHLLLPWLTPTLRLAVEPQTSGNLYPQLPRKQGHPFASQSHLRVTHLAHLALLRHFPFSANLAQSVDGRHRHRSNLAHPVIQDAERMIDEHASTFTQISNDT